jgi:hypothetical protein
LFDTKITEPHDQFASLSTKRKTASRRSCNLDFAWNELRCYFRLNSRDTSNTPPKIAAVAMPPPKRGAGAATVTPAIAGVAASSRQIVSNIARI